jgi:hypothetical protein
MLAQNPCILPNKRILADVAVPHLARDGRLHCHFGASSAKVRAGRTQAVYFSQRGIWGNKPPAFQEYWSRGCRRALVSFSVFACWPLWQLAQRKKSLSYLWMNRLAPNQPTPASTSNTPRRADQHCLTRHATSGHSDLRYYFSRGDRFVKSNSRDACVKSVHHFDQHAQLSHRTATVLNLRPTPTPPVQTGAQITTGGLSACLHPVLKTAAVSLMQDRSIC